jgi:hypothetical protein
MAINPMLHAGVTGLHNGMKGLRDAAQEVAASSARDGAPEAADSEPEPESGLSSQAEALLDLKLYKRQVQASAKVVETADEVIGFLLDVHA